MNTRKQIPVPADVPRTMEDTFTDNYNTITHNTHRLFLFACDQKIEHLNNDFYGNNISPDALHPDHLFKIATQGRIGAMATHLGLIARYGKQYPKIDYIVKLNAKTNLISDQEKDPASTSLWHIEHVVHLKETTGLNIRGIGYTIYLGSEYEGAMLAKAAQNIYSAHQHGLVTILWIYARGKYIKKQTAAQLAANATGLAQSLGADFVKIKPIDPQELQIATVAAGNTQVLCAGGTKEDPREFLHELYDQIHIGGTAGSATGRNIFQYDLPKAIAMTNAISTIVYDDKDTESAIKIFDKL
jgi:DhnA family fructose-bisphosphate aldolase class Ia